jgi:hydroxymethylpyrimidine/phosphomethylpyrimidine kinase
MQAAAHELLAKGARAVLLKGGHLAGEVVSDLLVTHNGLLHWMRAPRIHTANTHGTGCTLSSAIAAHLALGLPLLEAVEAARAYVRGALAAGAGVRTGAGSGPLNHGYAPQAMRLQALPSL